MARVANLLLGGWILASGLAIAPYPSLAVPQWIVGAVILVAEALALRWDPFRWVSFVAGAWLVATPFVFGLRGYAAFNDFAVGLMLCILATYARHPATYTVPPTYNQENYAAQGHGRAYR